EGELGAHDVGVRVGQDRAERRRRPHRSAAALDLPVPALGFQHATADGADDERGAPALDHAEAGIVDGFTGGRQRQAIRTRAATRFGDRGGHLGGDPTAKAFGLDQRDRTDRARPRSHTFPVRLQAGTEGADDPEARDDDAPHVRVARSAMNTHSVWNEAKCGARSWASSITRPKRSSMASDSSMKSSESSPTDPSTPFGSGVSRVTSDTRCGSKRSRVTKIVRSSSRTSLGSMPSSGLYERRGAPAPSSG